MSPSRLPHLKIILRAETKRNERRAPLTPADCEKLLQNGFDLEIEKSKNRIFEDELYEAAGCKLVAPGSWKRAPKDVYVLGLKELEHEDTPIRQRHIYFAHCYKGQTGWKELMGRFCRGGGEILDVEFMLGDDGRRAVAEFSPMAGFAGCALAIKVWCQQKLQPAHHFKSVSPYENQNVLIKEIKDSLADVQENLSLQLPRVLIIGANGRCGTGARLFTDAIGLPKENVISWGLPETKGGGPFPELLKYDILINCIFLKAAGVDSAPPAPFLTLDVINSHSTDRSLTVISDVSCDIGNPINPLPFIEANTTFDIPVTRLLGKTDSPLDIIAIDHLPSLLPLESSEKFSRKMLPHLLELNTKEQFQAWTSTAAMFTEAVQQYKSCQLYDVVC